MVGRSPSILASALYFDLLFTYLRFVLYDIFNIYLVCITK